MTSPEIDTVTQAALLIILSPFIGSHLGVLVDRLPRGENVVTRPSACRACGTRLAARDLIPILSFALNGGRCRSCRAALPAWLLYIEIAALGVGVCAVASGASGLTLWLTAGFLWVLLALGFADALWMRLPDVLNAMLLVLALALAWFAGSLQLALIGACLGSGAFFLIRVLYRTLRGREGLGLGDVKLMAGLGAFAGPFDLPLLVLIASLGGLIAALVLRAGQIRADQRLPFGAALCAAAAVLWVLRAGGAI
ncbi:prepilin peptidase [Pacificoceanicola onchidii]|uniref:prepilin peptidase n=1 Tax=Pacificoceanicola onchidii TaxID=2562685 RepID=UPI0010A4B63D|nr:A24 family peptidase [Pacificoceanicola onchidii]